MTREQSRLYNRLFHAKRYSRPEEDRPYLMDTIDYDTDIEPYRFVKIYAGVGSGKNYFIDALAKGGVVKHSDGSKLEAKSVLLITSRRAKVDEQLKVETAVYDPQIGIFDFDPSYWYIDLDPRYEDYYVSPKIKLSDLNGFGENTVYARNCALTNSKVEHYFRKYYMPAESSTHPWERFDMIVIDEAHAMLADASYQSAPFYVRRLIEETLKRSEKCKVIAMTGSPHVLRGYGLFDEAHEIDRMEVCRSVIPESIRFIKTEVARSLQKRMIVDNVPFVAFYNHINPIFSLIDDVPANKRSGVVASFSDTEKLRRLAKNYEGISKQSKDAVSQLAKTQQLPETVTAFLTTAKNKEGINIKNWNFNTMFVEAHNEIDVVQMCGRLRNGVDTLYIVADSVEHYDDENVYEALFSEDEKLLSAVNDYFARLEIQCKRSTDELEMVPANNYKELGMFIDYIHTKFPYLRFDYFTNQFIYYPERKTGRAYYFDQRMKYELASHTTRGLISLAKTWYHNVEISVGFRPDGDIQAVVDGYLIRENWLDGKREIRDTERVEILGALNQITGENIKQLGSLLKRYGYTIIMTNKKKDSPAIITKIVEGKN